ncbi:MAG: hypothetical protein D6732_19990, partial [Methanobacteriota archaeon]
MKKTKSYDESRFGVATLKTAIEQLKALAEEMDASPHSSGWTLKLDDAEWSYDSIDEFLADYRKCKEVANCYLSFRNEDYEILSLNFWQFVRHAEVAVEAPDRAKIEKIFDVFESDSSKSRLDPLPRSVPDPVVFIGHGRDPAWRDLKDHLQDKHNIQVEAYETGARAGHTIRDILEDMVSKSTFAILVLTAEDEQAGGGYRARQNVIHEAGLFQGRLGFSRAILLLEDGVEEFSNVQGIQYIRFSKNNIKETFGEVL